MWTVFVDGVHKKTFTNFARTWMYARACGLRFKGKTVTIVEA